MRKLSIMFVVAALVALASTGAALAQGPGQSKPKAHHEKSKAHHEKKYERTGSKERAEKQVRESQDKAKGKASRAEEQVRTQEERAGAAAGPERKAEMQARSQERKQIQEEYQTAQRSGEGEKVKGKKPWWKFWGSENNAD